MIRRSLKWAGLAILVLLAMVLTAPYWLLHTSPGSRWLWHRVAPLVPGELRASAVAGSLADGLELVGVSFTNPSLRVAAPAAVLALDLDLFPLALNVRRLHIDHAFVQAVERPPPEEPSKGFRFESLGLPLPVEFEDVRVRNLTVADGRGQPLIAVETAELAAAWYEKISLSKISVISSAGRIDGSADLALRAPYPSEVSIVGVYPLALGAGTEIPVQFTANARGDLDHLEVDVNTDDPHVRATGTLSGLIDELGWDLVLQSPALHWPLTGPSPQVSMRMVELRAQGELENYSVTGNGLVSVPQADETRFSLEVRGDLEGLQVERLELQGRMLDALAAGELRWEDQLAISIEAQVGRFDPSALMAAWPEGQPLTGTVDAAWRADRLHLEQVRLRVADTAQAVDAAGRVDIERGVVDLNIDWQDLQWPIDARHAAYRSEFGRIQVAGEPDAWTLEGSIAFAAAALPQGVFQLAGEGDLEELAVTLRESEVLGGNVAGLVTWRWKDGGPWSARLAADQIDVGALLPAWPGRVSTEFVASGRQQPLEIDVAIDTIEGVVRGRRVAGAGGLHYANGSLGFRDFTLASGPSRLHADGAVRRNGGLDFSLQVESLSDFYPGAGGALEGEGNLSLTGKFPVLVLDLEGRDLAWQAYRLEALTVDSRGMRGVDGIELDAEGRGFSLGESRVETISLALALGENRQALEAEATMDGKRAVLAADGRLDDWRKPFASTWSGRLETLRFEAPGDTRLALEQPTGLRLATDLAALERACLAGDDASRLCFGAHWARGSNFAFSADLAAVPVNLVQLALDTELEFTQKLDGAVSVGNTAGEPISAHALVDIAPGEIRHPLDPRTIVRTRAGVVSLDLDRGQLLSGRVSLPFGRTAQIDGHFGVDDVAAGSASSMNAELSVKLQDIGVLSTLVPAIDHASGQVDIDLGVAGTLASPDISGIATIRNGTLSYAPLGLKLADIQLQSRIHEDDRFDVDGTFTAGDGHGEIASSADSINSLRDGVTLSLNGTNLTLIDLPDVNVVTNLDLAFGLSRDELEINGDVLIPSARLTVSDIATARVSESEDVVIVASENAAEETRDEGEAPFAITGRVDLSLGKNVVIDMDAAEARVSGATAFTWNGPPMPTANGEYKMAGRYQAYGQLLEITEGSIRFPNTPADNPVLRIRAEREIFGNPRIRNAGILISGTAKDPQVEVYSTPPTTNERALTLLATGSDFDYEQGVGAVDVGTYIAPDVYISYGIGLFDRENVISLRYDLNKGFGIKATSGKRAEGIDLSYTIER